MKRITAALLALMLMLSVAVTAAVAEIGDDYSATAGYYYVYTENGKGLNVRDEPNGKVVGSLKYGTRIYCYYYDGGNGWALIDYNYDKPGYGRGTYACFISNRFLRKSKPPARTKSTAATVPVADTAAVSSIEALNQEFLSAVRVTPFVITVRPSRASGWVNLRWAPSMESTIMATYKANDQLRVLQETTNWYQAEDPETGSVGFISKEYVVK